MNDVRIVEGAAQMEDRIAGADVRQERIAQALALGGALHQAGDVDDVEEGGHLAAQKRKRITIPAHMCGWWCLPNTMRITIIKIIRI